MVNLHPLDRLRLQRGVEHLHPLGPRVTAEFLAAVGDATGGMPAILELLAQYRCLSPHVNTALGSDRFPPSALRVVP
jgi:hypothetical protein